MSRLLITGGAGFIGANFVRRRLATDVPDRVVVLDALTYAGSRTSLTSVDDDPRFRFVHGDVRDESLVAELMREEQIDTIVHFAAESHVDRSIDQPELFVDVNVVGTYRLLEAARCTWNDTQASRYRFHQVSTDEVFGSLGASESPVDETRRYAPNSPYAASKASADHMVRAYSQTYHLPVTISISPNNYGPYQSPEKLLPLAIVNLLRGLPVPIYGDGMNVRDWYFVNDHCSAIESVLAKSKCGETYNLGGGAELTNIEITQRIVTLIRDAFRNRPELAARYPDAWPLNQQDDGGALTFVEDRPGHDRRYAIDDAKARQQLGLTRRTSVDDGLRATLSWYFDNEDWWRERLRRLAASAPATPVGPPQ